MEVKERGGERLPLPKRYGTEKAKAQTGGRRKITCLGGGGEWVRLVS